MSSSHAHRPSRWRPRTYWNADLVDIANVKGDLRRACLRSHGRRGSVNESLSIRVLRQMTAALPEYLGGECLPEYANREVEIARLTLHPRLRAVVAIRARQIPGGIGYRAVSDWERVPEQRLVPSCDPLRPSELADRLTAIQLDNGDRLIHSWWSDLASSETVRAAIGSVCAHSFYYPGILDWYHGHAMRWAVQRHRLGDAAGPTDECETLLSSLIASHRKRVRDTVQGGPSRQAGLRYLSQPIQHSDLVFGIHLPSLDRVLGDLPPSGDSDELGAGGGD